MNIKNSILFILIPFTVLAHKINIFATVEGCKIYTQSYTSDGGKIKGGNIEVYDKAGNKLVSGKTDSLGEFSFVIPKTDDLKIVVISGMGHRAETIVSKDELPEIKIQEQRKKETPVETPKKVAPVIDTTLLKKLIEDAVEEKIHPLLRMMAEQKKEGVNFNEVVGGIGYIVGIIGIIAFFMKNKTNV